MAIHPRDVRSDDLRYLAALAESGRVAVAARSLGVDQSTVTRRLHALESALGMRVIDRSNDGWILTEAGSDLLEHARAVQRSVDSVVQYAAGVHPGRVTGTVRITSADGFGAQFVVPAVAKLQQQHPELNVELVTGARELALQTNSFDIAITLGARPATRFHVERLCEYANAFYGSRSYFERYGNPATLDELQDHRIVYFIDALERVRELDLSSYAQNARLAFSSPSIFAQLAAVRAGAGVGLLSKFMAQTVDEIHPIAAPFESPRVPVSMVLREEGMNRPAIAAVREALHREVRERRTELVWIDDSAALHQSTV